LALLAGAAAAALPFCYRWDVTQIACCGLLFDLDGVLIDSTHVVERVWRNWALEHGFEPEELIQKAHGRPSMATVRDYLPYANQELENREVERREMEDVDGIVALPGSRELLQSLPPDKWAIVTSCTRPLAEVRLRVAGLPMPKHLLTSSEVTHGKPHPEPYLRGAALLGVPASSCVVFEDVPSGVRAGKASGARVVAFRTTVDPAELISAGADWVADNCAAISVSSPDSVDTLTLAVRVESTLAAPAPGGREFSGERVN
jgi:mannitol-1-/sugar-/sorbitol-6-phosphatase